MISLLKELVETPGPSGFEHLIRKVVNSHVQSSADNVEVDALGNLLVRKGKRGDNGKIIMLAAHLDEIGIIITHIDKKGFARFTNIGGVSPRFCAGGRVRFLDGTVGVIGMEKTDKLYQVPTFDKMFVDVGAVNAKNPPIQVGDVAAFDRDFVRIPSNDGTRLVSKAIDDRIGVAILIETLRKLDSTPHEIYFVFSVQEEVGVRGATTAAYSINPDLGLAVDVTRTGDTPKGFTMEVALGQGPAIKVKDAGMLSDPRIVDWMVRTAEEAKIPYQMEILEKGGTDARAIQLNRAGVPAGCLSIPCRYVHSPSEMVDLSDVNHAVELLLKLLSMPVDF